MDRIWVSAIWGDNCSNHCVVESETEADAIAAVESNGRRLEAVGFVRAPESDEMQPPNGEATGCHGRCYLHDKGGVLVERFTGYWSQPAPYAHHDLVSECEAAYLMRE